MPVKPIKIIGLLATLVTGALLVSAVRDLPALGDSESPANDGETSRFYIEKTGELTHVPNLVTAVLADYRGYDTMFETVVIFTAGIAILAILRVLGPILPERRGLYTPPMPDAFSDSNRIIIGTTCRMLVPVIQVFALYVIFHGHYSPGGGFQGGVIFGASFILLAISGDLRSVLAQLSEKAVFLLAAVGILLYAGFGLACQFLGENFLDYHILHQWMPNTGPVMARYHSMLGVEIGVAFTVASIMFGIYAILSSRGKMEGGL